VAGFRSAPPVKETPACVECGATWVPADETRWQLHQVDIDEFAWYCPACAEREFGDHACPVADFDEMLDLLRVRIGLAASTIHREGRAPAQIPTPPRRSVALGGAPQAALSQREREWWARRFGRNVRRV
jgi:hypothetical protein